MADRELLSVPALPRRGVKGVIESDRRVVALETGRIGIAVPLLEVAFGDARDACRMAAGPQQVVVDQQPDRLVERIACARHFVVRIVHDLHRIGDAFAPHLRE